jgi:hypothetical protein
MLRILYYFMTAFSIDFIIQNPTTTYLVFYSTLAQRALYPTIFYNSTFILFYTAEFHDSILDILQYSVKHTQ